MLLAVSSLAAGAAAHPQDRSYCSVRTVPGGLDVLVELPLHLLPSSRTTGVPAPGALPAPAAAARVRAQVEREIRARTPAGDCQLETQPAQLTQVGGEPALAVALRFTCPEGPVILRNEWRLADRPRAETLCAVDGAPWTFQRGSVEVLVGTPPRLARVVWDFALNGAWHVVTGLDHVLFLVVLLMGLREAASLKARVLRMAHVVTWFTLGHSITLVCSGLGLLRVDARITETIIALSIVIVALENAWAERIRLRALNAGLFGLVHGLGFASALAETGLPERGALPALVAFNLGVEAAQLALVILVLPWLVRYTPRPWYRRRVLVPVSLCTAVLATIWACGRFMGSAVLPWLGS